MIKHRVALGFSITQTEWFVKIVKTSFRFTFCQNLLDVWCLVVGNIHAAALCRLMKWKKFNEIYSSFRSYMLRKLPESKRDNFLEISRVRAAVSRSEFFCSKYSGCRSCSLFQWTQLHFKYLHSKRVKNLAEQAAVSWWIFILNS